MSKDTPAFPINSPSGHPGYVSHRDGMTLRDWFAGQAVASGLDVRADEWELVAWFGKHRTGITHAEIIAARAYAIADAMISRRNVVDE